MKTDPALLPPPIKRSNWHKIILLVILILTVISTYSFWSIYESTQHIKTAFSELKLSQRTVIEQIKSLSQENQNQHKLQNQIEVLQKQINSVPSPINDSSILLMKAKYAIELAQVNAQWSNDSSTTIGLLKQAENYLAESSNAELFGVKEALAQEILAQEASASLDIVSLLTQLDAIQNQIQLCPYLKPSTSYEKSLSQAKSAQGSDLSLHEQIAASLKTLKQFFIIRHHEDPILPLLTPAYQSVQKEIIRLNIQEAEWAILQRDNNLYLLFLKKAQENIHRAFDENNPQAQTLLKHLSALQQIELKQEKIIPTESLTKLKEVIQQASETKNSGAPL